MPKVYSEGGYDFRFFSNENNEPPHIHVRKAEKEAKFWLRPVELERNYGFTSKELGEIQRMIRDNHRLLMRKWNAHLEDR